ncbi:MAG: hypothetical protein JNK15_20775 [Planctomycetes bacterium]|nr:hypothetical protein [Planctomycetota bacterium]
MNRFTLPFLVCLASLLPAQEPVSEVLPDGKVARVEPRPITVSVDFPGGTIAGFVLALRDQEPKVNVIVAPLAADAKLPRIELRGAGIEQALEAACAVAESKLLVRMKSFRGKGETVFTITAQEPTPMTNRPNAGTATPMPSGMGPAAAIEPPTVDVHSLQDIVESGDGCGLPIATVLSAIEAAVGADSGTTLRCHKESGLLIARGDRESLAVVQKVLKSLHSDIRERRGKKAAAEAFRSKDANRAAK